MQILYLVLCIVGALLPVSQFAPWLLAHGMDISAMVQQALAGPVSAFAWPDVAVSAAVLAEGRRLGMTHAWLSLLGLAVGVSLAFPLFLLPRERHLSYLERRTTQTVDSV